MLCRTIYSLYAASFGPTLETFKYSMNIYICFAVLILTLHCDIVINIIFFLLNLSILFILHVFTFIAFDYMNPVNGVSLS